VYLTYTERKFQKYLAFSLLTQSFDRDILKSIIKYSKYTWLVLVLTLLIE